MKGASLCSLIQGIIASKRMTSPEKSISQACLCVRAPKSLDRTGPLHLLRLNSTKAAQQTCRRRPPHSLLSPQRYATRMHSLVRKDRPPWPLTYSICATPRPLTPHADSVVAPQFLTHKAPWWPSHFTNTKRRHDLASLYSLLTSSAVSFVSKKMMDAHENIFS